VRDLSINAAVLFGLLAIAAGCKDAAPNNANTSSNKNVEAEEKIETFAHFVDRVQDAGIEFVPTNGEEANKKTILETLGAGVAMLDYDHDGDLDLFFSGGGRIGDDELIGRAPAMFRNEGDWQFTEVTVPTGLVDTSLYTHGAIAGDYNSDGFRDLLITGYNGLRLYRNQGDGSFKEVTSEAGLWQQAWSTSAAWGDLNGDGALDLYVTNYVDWSLDNNPPCFVAWGQNAVELQDTCAPEQFNGLSDWLFFGDGEGGFHELGSAAGLVKDGKGLAVLLGDLDLDGDLDIYVANDATPNFLYRNRGDGHLEEIGAISGTAFSDAGEPDGSMGVDLGDYNLDGLPDLWVSNYEDQSFALYRNEGGCVFQHVSGQTGITSVSKRYVGFGACFVDFDRDGDLDLFAANGHVKQTARKGPFRQLPLLFENLDRGRFVNVASQAGPYMQSRHMGRGVAVGDIDDDGDLDLAVSHTNQPVALLSNESATDANWLMLKLVGIDSHRDAVGTRVVVRTAGKEQTQQVKGGTSYLSTSDPRLFFGLGACDVVEEIRIDWASGKMQKLNNVSGRQVVVIHEGRQPSHLRLGGGFNEKRPRAEVAVAVFVSTEGTGSQQCPLR